LTDIGIESYKSAAALKGILAQRLVRRLCPHCRQLAIDPVSERLERYFPKGTPLYRPGGCGECSNTGYRGRLAILEILLPNAEVERRIAANESPDRIGEAAREAGMRSLWESGVQHVRAGVTTLDELLRVLEIPSEETRRPSISTSQVIAPSAPSASPSTGADEGGASSAGTTAAPRRNSGSVDASAMRKGTLHGAPTSPAFDGTEFDLLDGGGAGAGTVTPRSVLLVEDEDALRRVVRDLLERDGFIVYEAGDGVQALDEIDRAAPDIVVLDLNLPRLDGYGVLSHLRSRPATRDLPVIVLTAKGDEDSEVRVFEYGATEYITKPFRPRALIARLNALLNRR
jgi:CheY-like chemotaxis protein